MDSSDTAINNPLVSARLAACDPHYRSALWMSVALTGVVACAAVHEWLAQGSATVLGETLVLMETIAIYARAALVFRMPAATDVLAELATGVVLAILALSLVAYSFATLIEPRALDPTSPLRLFALAMTIEFLSLLILLEARPTITSLLELSLPRFFACVALCALLIIGMWSAVVPATPIDGILGLCIAMMSLLSATDCIKNASCRK
jgi:hypothetical protein